MPLVIDSNIFDVRAEHPEGKVSAGLAGGLGAEQVRASTSIR